MVIVFLGLLLGLQFKHFVADYLLQSSWIIAGKGSLRAPGGYAHAGIHAAFSLVVLLVFGTPVLARFAICIAEFVVFNPGRESTFTREFMRSKSINTPYLSKTLKGLVERVIFRGSELLTR